MPDFPGFRRPTYTPVPDELFDELLPQLGEAELKVLLYIIRRTFGFKKDADPISYTQFLRGITTKNGTVLDRGCGVKSSRHIRAALKSLEEKGIIVATRHETATGEKKTTVYSLHFADDVLSLGKYPTAGRKVPVLSQGKIQETVQETDTQEVYSSKANNGTDAHYVNNGTSNNRDADEVSKPVNSNGTKPRSQAQKTARENGEEHNPSNHRNIEATQNGECTPAGEHAESTQPVPLSDAVQQYVHLGLSPAFIQQALPTKDELWYDLKTFFSKGFSVELHDEANIVSTTTRAHNLFKRKQEQQPGFDFGTFVSLMYEAKSITQDRSGSIKKKNEHGFTTKMAYFFAVLENKLGFKQKPPRAD